MAKKQNFEQMLNRLEEIVKMLESGEYSLETSLKFFEEGKKISDDCLKNLNEVEKKVSMLIDKKGATELVPFPESDEISDEEEEEFSDIEEDEEDIGDEDVYSEQ